MFKLISHTHSNKTPFTFFVSLCVCLQVVQQVDRLDSSQFRLFLPPVLLVQIWCSCPPCTSPSSALRTWTSKQHTRMHAHTRARYTYTHRQSEKERHSSRSHQITCFSAEPSGSFFQTEPWLSSDTEANESNPKLVKVPAWQVGQEQDGTGQDSAAVQCVLEKSWNCPVCNSVSAAPSQKGGRCFP